MIGQVSWWNRRKGYGFILSSEGEDIFVHYTDLLDNLRNLKANDEVEFSIGQCDHGTKAVNVRKIGCELLD